MSNIITQQFITDMSGKEFPTNSATTALLEGAQDFIERLCGGKVVERREFVRGTAEERTYTFYSSVDIFAVEDCDEIEYIKIAGVQLASADFIQLRATRTGPVEYIRLSLLATSPKFLIDELHPLDIVVKAKFGYSTNAPAVVKTTIARMVLNMYGRKQIKSESINDYSVTFEDVSESLKAEKLLAPYIRKSMTRVISGQIQV
jgi:hypothetical protein